MRIRPHIVSVGLLVTALVSVTPGSSPRAQSAAESERKRSWLELERGYQSLGPAAVDLPSREALARHPRSLAILLQRLRVLSDLRGADAAAGWVDTLEMERLEPAAALHLRAALSFQRGRPAQEGIHLLEGIESPLSGVDGVAGMLVAARSFVTAGGSHLSRADSVLTVLTGSSVLSPSELEASSLGLQIEILREMIRLRRGSHSAKTLELLGGRAQEAGWNSMAGFLWRELGMAGMGEDREQAISWLNRAVESFRIVDNRRQMAATQNRLGYLYEQSARPGDALRAYQSAAELMGDLQEDMLLGFNRLGLGWNAIRRSLPTLAERSLEEAYETFSRMELNWARGLALNNLGVLYYELEEYDEAARIQEEALALARSEGDRRREAYALNNLGNIHSYQGRPDLSMARYQEALEIQRELGDLREQCTLLNNLGHAALEQAEYRQALVFLNESVALGDQTELQELATNAWMNLALARYWGPDADPDGAFEALDRAMELVRRQDDRRGEARLLVARGRLLLAAGHTQEAVEQLQRGASLMEQLGIVGARFTALENLALGLHELGGVADARSVIVSMMGLELDRRSKASLLAKAQTFYANNFRLSGDLPRAQRESEEALRRWDTARGHPLHKAGLIDAAFSGVALNEYMASHSLGEVADVVALRRAFEFLQSRKSRSLLDYVHAFQAGIEPSIPAELMEAEREARLRMERSGARLESARTGRDSLELALTEAEARYLNVRRRILDHDLRFRQASELRAVNLDQARSSLPPGALVLDFNAPSCSERRDREPWDCSFYMFALDADSLTLHRLEDQRELERQLDLYLELVRGGAEENRELLRGIEEDLSRRILDPVARRLSEATQLIVAPDGGLQMLPFASLRIGDGYLVESMPVTIVPSLSVLSELRNRSEEPTARDLTVWAGRGGGEAPSPSDEDSPGRALPHASLEIESLLRRFDNSIRVDGPPGPDQNGGDSEIVHFVAHGYFDERKPWRSGLYLDPGSEARPPVRLEIADVYHLELRSELVTVSACETARSTTPTSLGLSGFAQALMGAGARSVLATLWPVEDASAATFMLRFYEHLAHGASKAEALQRTQLGFLEDEHLRHPFHWAGYVLMGDGEGTVRLRSRRRWTPSPELLFGTGVLLFLVGVGWWRRHAA